MRRSYALSSMGQTEEALIAFCVSTWLNKTSTISHPTLPEVSKVHHSKLIFPISLSNPKFEFILQLLHQLLSSTRKSSPFPLATPYIRRRRKRRHYNRKIVAECSDCDEENSSCVEDDSSFTKIRQRRSAERRVKSVNSYGVTDSVIIPRPNTRIRGLIDRIHEEIYRIQSEFWLMERLKTVIGNGFVF